MPKVPPAVKELVRQADTAPPALYVQLSHGAVMHPRCARARWRSLCLDTIRSEYMVGWAAQGIGVNEDNEHKLCVVCGDHIECVTPAPRFQLVSRYRRILTSSGILISDHTT